MDITYSYETPRNVQAAEKNLNKANEALEKAEATHADAKRELRDAQAELDRRMRPIREAEAARDDANKRREKTKEVHNLTKKKGTPGEIYDARKVDDVAVKELRAKQATLNDMRNKHAPKNNPKTGAAKRALDRAQKGLQSTEQSLQKAKEAADQKAKRKADMENVEKQRRERGFGRFKAPLEARLEGDVLASFALLAPQQKDQK